MDVFVFEKKIMLEQTKHYQRRKTSDDWGEDDASKQGEEEKTTPLDGVVRRMHTEKQPIRGLSFELKIN